MMALMRGVVLGGLLAVGSTSIAALRQVEPAPARAHALGVVVDLSERRLDVRIDGELHASYEVAVGRPGHRTPTGTHRLSRVIWNPSWVPPEREWARDAEPKGPGEPGNPMGRVKIFFDDLLYIHGTEATESLGEPASHGCIRMRNRDAIALARLVMEHGGAAKSEGWVDETLANATRTREVQVPEPPILRITQ